MSGMHKLFIDALLYRNNMLFQPGLHEGMREALHGEIALEDFDAEIKAR
jgi:hypothetical protein